MLVAGLLFTTALAPLQETFTGSASALAAARVEATNWPEGAPLSRAPAGLRSSWLRALHAVSATQRRPGMLAGPSIPDYLGAAVAVSDGTAVIGAWGVNNAAGAAYVFVRSGSRWLLQVTLSDPRKVPGNDFGDSVAISGTTVIVSAPGVNDGAGAAYVFARAGKDWHLQATLSDPASLTGYAFGDSVAVAGTTTVITALGVNQGSGEAYVYAWSGSRWRRQAVLSAPSGPIGLAVALSGATAVIGAAGANGEAGATYVYARSGTSWHSQATLSNPAGTSADGFGAAVAISGDTVVIGAPNSNTDPNAVYVYVRSGTTWRQQVTLSDPGGAAADRFGRAVAVSGDTVVIGAPGGDDNAGTTYVYVSSGTQWRTQAQLADPGGQSGDTFGRAVALSGGTALIGAFGDNDGAGAAYAFVRTGTRWSRQAALINPRGLPGNHTGISVAISGATAVVGADGAAGGAGAASVYVRSGKRWRLQATLSDPGGYSYDNFGSAVAVSGATAVIEAAGEGSGSGTAYVYVRTGSRWRQQATLSGGLSYLLDGSVALSGNTAVIGGVENPAGTGIAQIYVRSGTRWRLQTTLIDPGPSFEDYYGAALAISGATAVIGANGTKENTGAAYVYVRSGTRWRRQAKLSDPGGRLGDNFSWSVAITGRTVILGANGTSKGAGMAYVYVRSGSRWHRQVKLADPSGIRSGGFGGAVAITGAAASTRVLVSGLSLSGLATGKRQCGSVFEFGPARRRWRELARVVDPSCRSYDNYGYALALSGTTAVIGAPGADHNQGTAYVIALP